MIRSRYRRILAGIPLAVLAATPTLAMAHPRSHAASTDVTVVEHALTDSEIPVAKGGTDEKGDPLTFTNPVYNAADTRRIGHEEGFCMRLEPAKGIWECLWTTFLPAGQITVQGPFYDNANSVLSVTGGTGRYRNVRGQMTLHAFDGSKRYRFGFQLSS